MGSRELCITVDTDWAHDAVIADMLALIAAHEFQATWFVTHATPVLVEIAAAPGQELAVHPNFNPLFEGVAEKASDILLRLREVVPNAVSIRSHSLTRSSRLASLFQQHGFTHESNYFVPPRAGAQMGPWNDFSGLIQVPIRWEDDVRLLDASIGEPIEHLHALRPLVVNFHPVHVFLNSATMQDYETARPYFGNAAGLIARRRPPGSGGSRDRLIALLLAARSGQIRGTCLRDLQPAVGA